MTIELDLVHTAEVAKPASACAMTLNLITLGLGTGLLSMPWSTAGASIGTMVVSSFFVLLLNLWTMIVIVQASERWQEFDLGFLLGHLPGGVGVAVNVAVTIFVVITQFLCMLSQALVITNALVTEAPGGSAFHNRVLMCCLSGVLLFLVSLLPQQYLSFSSAAVIFANIYVTMLLIAYAVGLDESETEIAERGIVESDNLCFFGLAPGALSQVSNLMYCISFHACIPPMYFELEHRSVAKFTKCLCAAFFILFLLIVTVSVSGYVAFGPKVHSDVLDSFPVNSLLGNVGKFSMSLSLFGCFPLQVPPVIAPVVNVFRHRSGADSYQRPLLLDKEANTSKDMSERFGRPLLILLTGFVVVLVMGVSLTVSSLGVLNNICGAACAFGHTGVIPASIGLYLLGEVPRTLKAAFSLLLAGTAVIAVLGFFITDNFVSDLTHHCILG